MKLIQALRTLLLEQAKNNDVLIYFTGHGIPVFDPVVGKPKAYLATSDTIVTIEGKQVIEQQRAVSLDSLNDLIQESQFSSSAPSLRLSQWTTLKLRLARLGCTQYYLYGYCDLPNVKA